ncbi:MAG: sulfatase [Paenibacillaceae bacterium]|jgi:arylsulfatase A-like enzyme|nr:sulfatase [Paenibacillaceae bacterium]
MKKPNILFFFTDDQRFDTIHALGNSEISTPNMDKLVENGTAFTHAHIPCGTSPAVCMPSRAMLHAGRTLFHLEGLGQQIPKEHTTLGEAFQGAGYRTFGAGKWHNGPAAYARSFTDGDAIFFGGMWDHWNVPFCHYDPSGKYDKRILFTENFSYNNATKQIHCEYYSMGEHSTDVIAGAALNFIEKAEPAEPFLMYVSFLAPHDPRSMPRKFKEMYDPEKVSLPANFLEEHPFDFGASHIRDEVLLPTPRPEAEIRKHIAEYYGMISHVDDAIGRVIAGLNAKGMLDDTIIVLAGDNGLAVGQHGLMGKQNHYEHSVRVPMIFSGPGVPKGLKLDQYAYLLDIYPTLCDLAGVEKPASVEGHSLLPVMNDPQKTVRNTLYFAYVDLIRSVKDERFKLIEYAGRVRETQLFDLHNDPLETVNLYGNPEYDEVVRQKRTELKKYRDEWDDELHPLGKSYWSNYE